MIANVDLIQLIVPIAATIGTVGGAWLTIQKIKRNIREEKDIELKEILSSAREEIAVVRSELELKINETQNNLKNLEININKDIEHLREIHISEVRSLSEKIQSLRDDLRTQHTSILDLLNRLVSKD